MYSKEELKNLKLEFWESFAAFCEVQPYLRGRKKIWTLVRKFGHYMIRR